MTGLNSRLLKAFARAFNRDAQACKKPIADYLLDRLTRRVATVEEGRLLTSLTNGEQGSSNWTPTGELAQSRVLEIISDLLDRYDKAKTDLVTDGLQGTPQPDQIFTRMLQDIVPCREAFQDNSGLRLIWP